MNHFDAIVIGLGGWGSATLYHLARRGLKVCGVEQYPIGHDRGSSHGESRIIRMAYFLHPDYVPVLRRAYELWHELETQCGESLMHLPGLLCFGSPEGDLIQGLGRCYAGTELAHERFDAAEAMRRFPQFRLPESDTCFWDPFGGYLFPEKCLRTHVQEAQLAGATLLQGEQVLALEDSRESVTVHTRNHTLGAARVVIASGAFTNRLLAAADSRPISAVRKVLFWYRMTDPGAFIPEKFPAWIGQQNGREFYGFPTLDRHGIKAAEDSGGQAVEDPALVKRDLLPEDEANLRPFLERTFGSQLQERLRHKTCLYEMTEDRHFIVDRHPAWENVTIAAGGSGHGYKFCSVIGEMAAQMAIDGRAPGRPEILAARGRL